MSETAYSLDLGFADPKPVRKWALISPCKQYRYGLTRIWDRKLGLANFLMLNPSDADASIDDPTVRRCIGFAQEWGLGGIVVTNLFALRSPKPEALRAHEAPVGPHNDAAILSLGQPLLVVAWGAHPFAEARIRAIVPLIKDRRPQCLGLTATGQPRHPLFVPRGTPLRDWTPT